MMGPEKPGIFVCPDKIKDLSLSHAFPQGMLFYSPKNFKAMMKNNETFTYKGHSYLIPTHNDENANIRFTGFKLKFNGQTLTPGDGEEPYFTITDANADQSFSLFMEETDCDDMSAVYIVPFYIYREDESQPLLALTESMTGDFNFEATFPASDRPIGSGSYFLLVNSPLEDGDSVFHRQGNRLIFPFSILKTGDASMFPAIAAAKVMRPKDACRAGRYTSGKLQLQIQSANRSQEPYELTATCYTEDWGLAASDKRMVTKKSLDKDKRNFCLHWDRIWMPGNYTVVLSYNREPFYAVSFDYRGEAVTPGVCRCLSPQDAEYRLTKLVDSGNTIKWKHIREFTGMAEVKLRLAELSQSGEYNKFCQEQQLDILKMNSYVAITAPVAFHAKRTAYCLPRLLGYCTTEYKQLDCAEWMGEEKPEKILEMREGLALTLSNLSVLFSGKGIGLLHSLEKAVEESEIFWALTLCGTEEEMKQLFDLSPILERHIRPEYRLNIHRPSAAEMVHLIQNELSQTTLSMAAAAEHRLALQVCRHISEICQWTKGDIHRFVSQGIIKHFKQRIHARFSPGENLKRDELTTLQAEDISLDAWMEKERMTCRPQKSLTAEQAFDESMKELNEMVGLQPLKTTLTATLCQIRFNRQRKRLGLPTEESAIHHMIFTGNPGTGKTTVAKLMGKIFHSLGLLSTGEVITTGRNELVGTYIGQTEEKVRNILKRARGNVLFIDEAYNLYTDPDDHRDYGSRIIEGLLPVLAEPNPDMLIILAGYEDEMEQMLQANPGLKGRFPHTLRFNDYSAEELMQIARLQFDHGAYRMSPEAECLLRATIAGALADKDRYFSNARWIKQFIASGILPAMAQRVMTHDAPDNIELYRTIERCDIEQAAEKLPSRPAVSITPRRRIGFRA